MELPLAYRIDMLNIECICSPQCFNYGPQYIGGNGNPHKRPAISAINCAALGAIMHGRCNIRLALDL